MDRNESSKPVFWVARESGGLRINVPVQSEQYRTLLNLVWVLVWAAGEVAIVFFILAGLNAPESVPFPLAGLFLAAFTVAGGVVLWRLLWRVGGRESFLVAREALLARREIWGIGRSRRFDHGKTRSVNAARLKDRVLDSSWGRMFIGQGEGEIVIHHAGRTYAYGKGLEIAEAAALVDLLEEEMDFQFHKVSPREAKPPIFI
jgi:hypothetical protein